VGRTEDKDKTKYSTRYSEIVQYIEDPGVEGALEEIFEVIGASAFGGSARRTTNWMLRQGKQSSWLINNEIEIVESGL